MTGFHIEFVGLSGAGKTKLHSDFLKLTRKRSDLISYKEALYNSFKISGKFSKELTKIFEVLPYGLGKYFLFSLYSRSSVRMDELTNFQSYNPNLYLLVLNIIQHYEQDRGWGENTLKGVNNFLSLYNLISKSSIDNNEGIIFDEGFCQRGLSMFATNPSIKPKKQDVINYIRKIPLPKFILYVSADPKICIKRIKNRRDPSRIKKLSNKNIKKIMDNGEIYLKYLLPEMKKRGARVIEIKNTNFECSIKQLKKVIGDISI